MFSERLKQLRKDRDLTLDELARAYNERFGGGLNKGTLSKYENGRQEPMMSVAGNLARFFGVTVDYLIGDADVSTVGVVIPILAGLRPEPPYYAAEDMIGYEEIPARVASGGDHFALHIKDDSMMPQMREGDTVIVRRQNRVSDGDLVAAVLNGGDTVIRKYRCQENGGAVLVPFNPQREPIAFTEGGRVCVVGRVVELRGRY